VQVLNSNEKEACFCNLLVNRENSNVAKHYLRIETKRNYTKEGSISYYFLMHKEELMGEKNHICISAVRHKSIQLYSDENILVRMMLFKMNLLQILHM